MSEGSGRWKAEKAGHVLTAEARCAGRRDSGCAALGTSEARCSQGSGTQCAQERGSAVRSGQRRNGAFRTAPGAETEDVTKPAGLAS